MAEKLEWAAALAALRAALGYKQKTLAQRAGMHFTQLSRYENGLEHPNSAVLHRLLQAAEVSPADFYRLEEVLRSILQKRPSGGGNRSALPPPDQRPEREAPTEPSDPDRVARDAAQVLERLIKIHFRKLDRR